MGSTTSTDEISEDLQAITLSDRSLKYSRGLRYTAETLLAILQGMMYEERKDPPTLRFLASFVVMYNHFLKKATTEDHHVCFDDANYHPYDCDYELIDKIKLSLSLNDCLTNPINLDFFPNICRPQFDGTYGHFSHCFIHIHVSYSGPKQNPLITSQFKSFKFPIQSCFAVRHSVNCYIDDEYARHTINLRSFQIRAIFPVFPRIDILEKFMLALVEHGFDSLIYKHKTQINGYKPGMCTICIGQFFTTTFSLCETNNAVDKIMNIFRGYRPNLYTPPELRPSFYLPLYFPED